MRLLAVVVLVAVLAAAAGPGPVSGANTAALVNHTRAHTPRHYYVHENYIGPENQQYNESMWFHCSSAEPTTCIGEAAAACDEKGWCKSFGVENEGLKTQSNTIQLYTADWNGSLPNHPRWTLHSIGDIPPKPGPPPPSPTPDWDREFYCDVKHLAYDYALQLQPQRAPLGDAFDSLQLKTSCNLTLPSSQQQISSHPSSSTEPTAMDPTAIDNVIYVDGLHGADVNCGTLSSPVRTISRGITLAIYEGLLQVALRGHQTYFLGGEHGEGIIQLASNASGMTIAAYNGEPVVISGGVNLSATASWSVSSTNPNIWVTDVEQLPLPVAFSTLFVGPRRAIRARFPNANPEMDGLHTPNRTGYLAAELIKTTNVKTIGCSNIDFSDAPSVPNFCYGKYHGGTMTTPWVPNYTSYWCGGWKLVGGFQYDPTALPNIDKYPDGAGLNGAVLSMTRGSSDVWANYQWELINHDSKNHTFLAGRGGYQFPRGLASPGFWFVENIKEELDVATEWFYDSNVSKLYYFPHGNQTDLLKANSIDFVATQLETLIDITGSAEDPVKGIVLKDLTFAHSEITYLKDYEAPTGGGYSTHRGAAVKITGSENVVVTNCTFDSPGGNGILFNAYNRDATVEDSEFKFVGDAAILQLGITQYWNATDGNQPWRTKIFNNYIHDIGIYGKQGAGFVQALAAQANLTNNIIFNGPRAGVEWLDGMGGGNHFQGNLLWALNRESTDHGCTNSWDRVPYLSKDPRDGTVRLGPALNTMTRNFLICDYQCTWPLDHDDGSNNYLDTFNFLLYGGAKNFLGHSKTSRYNLYVLPDAKPVEGGSEGGGPKGGKHCANNDGAVPLSSGWNETYRDNRCILSAKSSFLYAYDRCNPSNLTGTVDFTANNSFMLWKASPNESMHDWPASICGAEELNLSQYQAHGYDVESTVSSAPDSDTILSWGRELLGMT